MQAEINGRIDVFNNYLVKALSLYIKLLKYCNLHCSYCYEQEHFNNPQILSLPDVKIILLNAKNYARKEKINKLNLNYTGGEVLTLGEEYLESLFNLSYHLFKKSKIKVSPLIQTNLTLMSERYIKLLKKYKVSVGISFDVYGGQRKFKNGETAITSLLTK